MANPNMKTRQKPLYQLPLTILLLAQLFTALPIEGPLLGIIWFAWIIFCSFYAFNICLERKTIQENTFAIVLLAFWILNVISYFISPKYVSSLSLSVETLTYIKSITIALFSFFPFYYYSKHGIANSNLRPFIIFLLFTSALRIIFGNITQTAETSEEHNVLNQAYLFAQIIPLILVCFRGRQVYLLIAISALFVLWGAKRGAILCMAVNVFIVFIYLLKEDSFGKKHRGRILLLIFILVIIGVYFILGNEFLQGRLLSTGSEDDRSGEIRNEMYLILYNVFIDNSTQSELLFGRGLAQTVGIADNLAHQDWLELLIDNGIVGLAMYVVLILLCFKGVFKKTSYTPAAEKYALICCFFDWCLIATYSMVYASRDSFILFMSLGVILGSIQKYKKQGKNDFLLTN